MYKVLGAIPLLIFFTIMPAMAQSHAQLEPSASGLPDKPETKAANLPEKPAQSSSANPHLRVADKKFWILTGLQLGATVADFETTQWAQRMRPDGGELNPLYGRHPGRPRMYSIGLSLDAVQILMQYRSKTKAQETGKLKKAWIVGALLNTGVHAALAVHNGQIAGQGQGGCTPGQVCR